MSKEFIVQDCYNEFFFKLNDDNYNELFVELVFDLGFDAVEEKDGGFYVRSDESLDDLLWALQMLQENIRKKHKIDIKIHHTLSKKRNKDWIEEYKNSINPIQIDNVYIHSSWHKPKKECINIKIDPALAFGSGHHESTNSCIKFIQKYAKKDYEVLDLGCGSGILSILLAKMGCVVDACDIDEIAIESTVNNAKLNNVQLNKIWQGSIHKTKSKYDIIVANLTAEVLRTVKDELCVRLNNKSYLILSGILNKYEDDIKEDFASLKLVDSLKMHEWTSLVYEKE